MNLRYKMSSCLHISIATTTHLMLVFLNAGSLQYFHLKKKKKKVGEERNLICQFLSKVVHELSGFLPVQFCMFIC